MIDILNHIQSRINESQIISYPFPHLLIGDFFPEDLYQEMLKQFPIVPNAENGDNYLAPENDKNVQGNIWLRVRDKIYPEALKMLESKLYNLITDRVFELQSYKYFLDGKLPEYPLIDSQTAFWLLQRKEDFYISPHIHAPSEYLSIIHYLPEDNSHAQHGTQMYAAKRAFDINIPWNTFPHISTAALDSPLVAPYCPNTAIIWVPTQRAIHGRTVTNIMRRYIYAYRLFNDDRVNWSKGSLQVRVEP